MTKYLEMLILDKIEMQENNSSMKGSCGQMRLEDP
jgi:hypothetical protein